MNISGAFAFPLVMPKSPILPAKWGLSTVGVFKLASGWSRNTRNSPDRGGM